MAATYKRTKKESKHVAAFYRSSLVFCSSNPLIYRCIVLEVTGLIHLFYTS